MKELQGGPGICARCSAVYGSCCVAYGDDDIHHTFVSRPEASVISGAARDCGALMSEPNSEVFIKRIGSMFPDRLEEVVKAFPLNKLHSSLSVDCFGRCTLLGSGGCVLAEGQKPLFCRIYPFWFINGVLVTFNNDRCLALRESGDTGELLDIFGVDEAGLRDIYAEIVLTWLGKNIS